MTIQRPHPIYFLGGRSTELYRAQLAPQPRPTRVAESPQTAG